MKFAWILVTCLVLYVSGMGNNNKPSSEVDEDDEVDQRDHVIKFEEFKKRHKKKYKGQAGAQRFKQWKQRKRLIERHNREAQLGKSSFKMVDNALSDQTDEEWETLFGINLPHGVEIPSAESDDDNARQTAIPQSFDLRNHRCMPPIKTQTPCGACWAFLATTSVEYQTCLRNSSAAQPPVLSEQQLIDCSASYGTKGCNGGFYTQAWNYVVAAGGQTFNSTYPFQAAAGSCQFTKSVTSVGGRVSRYPRISPNETLIQQALVQRGPVTVSIIANSQFILYSSGIFDDDACTVNGSVNHGLVLVGYGSDDGTDYWIARNSWGTEWGIDGYILIKRKVNLCRLADYAFQAT